MRVPVLPLYLAAATALAGPAAAGAATTIVGSNLAADPGRTEAHPTDTAFWPTALASGDPIVAPANGQVLSIRVKGTAIPSTAPDAPPPDTRVHFQTLAPQSDGSVKIILTSGMFTMPFAGERNQVSTFLPENLCIEKGQFVAFNTLGGFDPNYYPRGTPFVIIGAVDGSSTDWYEKVDGTNNGDVMTGQTLAGQELLMQYTLGTDTDAAGVCGGTPPGTGTETPPGTGTGTPPGTGTGTPPGTGSGGTGGSTTPVRMKVIPQRIYVTRKRIMKPGIHCPSQVARCKGTASIRVKGKTHASTAFAIAGGRSAHVTLKLSHVAYRVLRRARGKKMSASLRLVSQLGTASGAVVLQQ
jgi:hypothetical protein